MNEAWLPINGWDGLYEISNLGNVRSLDRAMVSKIGTRFIRPGRVMKTYKHKKGYMYISLCRRQRVKNVRVHILVARHFLPPSDLPEVNHKDLNKANNVWTNLEWSTRDGNRDHAILAGVFDPVLHQRRSQKLNIDTVYAIRHARTKGETYQSIADEFSVCVSTAWVVVNKKTWISA